MFAWGIITGIAVMLLLQEVGKAFGAWARKKWFNQDQF